MNVVLVVAEVEVEFLVVGAGVVLMADLMVVLMVVLSEIKYERRFFCFGFGIKKSLWLPRCCCFEKETEEEKWMGFSSLSDVRIFGAAMKIKYERSSSLG